MAAIAAMVSTMVSVARRTGSSHSRSTIERRILRPTVNSETITATSVTRSNRCASCTTSQESSPSPFGPSSTPRPRYSAEMERGRRWKKGVANARLTSRTPIARNQRLAVMCPSTPSIGASSRGPYTTEGKPCASASGTRSRPEPSGQPGTMASSIGHGAKGGTRCWHTAFCAGRNSPAMG